MFFTGSFLGRLNSYFDTFSDGNYTTAINIKTKYKIVNLDFNFKIET